MAVAAAIMNDVPGGVTDEGQKTITMYGTLTFSGSYATGGDAVSFAGLAPLPKIASPVQVWITGINGYNYQFVKSTGKIKVSTTANTELTAGAYPAGITGDTVCFEAVFPKA